MPLTWQLCSDHFCLNWKFSWAWEPTFCLPCGPENLKNIFTGTEVQRHQLSSRPSSLSRFHIHGRSYKAPHSEQFWSLFFEIHQCLNFRSFTTAQLLAGSLSWLLFQQNFSITSLSAMSAVKLVTSCVTSCAFFFTFSQILTLTLTF